MVSFLKKGVELKNNGDYKEVIVEFEKIVTKKTVMIQRILMLKYYFV